MSETSTFNNVLSMLRFCIYSFCMNMILVIVFFIKRVSGKFIAKSLEFVANAKSICNDMANVYFLVHPELNKKINSLKGHFLSNAEAEYLHNIRFMDLPIIISKAIVEILSILNLSSMPFDEKKLSINKISRKSEEQLLISITPYNKGQCRSLHVI